VSTTTPSKPEAGAAGLSVESPHRRHVTLPVETGVFVVLLLLVVWLGRTFPDFRSGANLSVILTSVAEIGIVAAGMTLVIATGGIDISVGSIVGLCGVVLGLTTVEKQWGVAPAIAATLAAGAGCGLVNGLLIARFKLPPIIATLAMFSAARAGAYVLSQGNSISGLPEAITNIGYGSHLGVPTPAWIALAALVAIGILLKKTAFGRGVLAMGGNREAARLSGLATRRTEIIVYLLSGLLAGLAAVVVTARGATAVPDAGKFFELRAITAVVVGGTPVVGGKATLIGTALGVLTIGVVQNGVVSYGKDAMWEMLVMAAVLLASVEVDRWRRARAEKVRA
jgi:ribose/xylose/arabinose/galactoside ABC-type transport system permease subunit